MKTQEILTSLEKVSTCFKFYDVEDKNGKHQALLDAKEKLQNIIKIVEEELNDDQNNKAKSKRYSRPVRS